MVKGLEFLADQGRLSQVQTRYNVVTACTAGLNMAVSVCVQEDSPHHNRPSFCSDLATF